MKITKILTPLLLLLLFVASCKRKDANVEPHYDFTFDGSLYSGDSIIFVSAVGPKDSVTWDFGNWLTLPNEHNDGSGCVYNYNSVYSEHFSVTRDTSLLPVVKHFFVTPGTYTVTLTVNKDTAHKVKKVLTILSPEEFTSKLSGPRIWQRVYRKQLWNSDTTYQLPDTVFALIFTNKVCYAPHYGSSFNWCGSSSKQLLYANESNHYVSSYGNVRCDLIKDSIFISERTKIGGNEYIYINYSSGH